MKNYISSNIRFLRKKHNFTQQALADLIDKKKSVIGSYEKEIAHPSVEIMAKMSDIFGVPWHQLVDTDLTEYPPYPKSISNLNDGGYTAYSTAQKEIEQLQTEAKLKDKLIQSLESENALLKDQLKTLKK